MSLFNLILFFCHQILTRQADDSFSLSESKTCQAETEGYYMGYTKRNG